LETGFYILPDRMIRGPHGKTLWSVTRLEHVEAVWGPAGDSGWRIAGGCFFDPRGAQTSYFVVENGDGRVIHGPDPKLPWT
jgi:hypothetical protein